MNPKKHRILERTVVCEGFLRVARYRLAHTLFAGGWGEPLVRELMHRGPVAAVLPYDPDADRVLLIEQFRVGALGDDSEPWLLEAIAGVIEDGEDALELVRREAIEEAGCVVHELVPVSEYWVSPGCTDEYCTVFCGRADLSEAGGVHGLAEEGEDILVHTMAADEALGLLRAGRIRNSLTVIALQWLALQRATGTPVFA